jgi:GNAT superfamily N-acetyltransferase
MLPKADFQFHYLRFQQIESLRRNYFLTYKELCRFWKTLEKCPQISPEFPCFFFLTDNRKQIVSSLRAYPDTLFYDGKGYPWAWLADLYTDPACRGKGLASLVIEGSRDTLHNDGIAWGGVSSNEIALRIYKRLGFDFPGYGKRFLALKVARPFLEPHLRSQNAVRLADCLYRPVMRATAKLFRLMRCDGAVAEVIPIRSERDLSATRWNLVRESKYQFENSISRLFWKLGASNERSENNSFLYLLVENKTREVLCYFVIRSKYQREPLAGKYKDFDRLTLTDYGLFRNDESVYSKLAGVIIEMFWKSKAEVLDAVTSSAELGRILKRVGMARIGKGESFVFALPPGWKLDADLHQMNEWRFTGFTGDMFTF